MKSNVKITLSYRAPAINKDAFHYRIEKLQGAVSVAFRLGTLTVTARVGTDLNEEQANELVNSRGTEVTVVPRKDRHA